MQYLIATGYSILILVMLTACGNKGPLYLPNNEPPPVSMSPTTPPDAPTNVKDDTEE